MYQIVRDCKPRLKNRWRVLQVTPCEFVHENAPATAVLLRHAFETYQQAEHWIAEQERETAAFGEALRQFSEQIHE